MSSDESFRPERTPIKRTENPFNTAVDSNKEGIEIKGNMPPELLQRINSFSQQTNNDEVNENVNVNYQPKVIKNKKVAFNNPVTTSNKLQEILEGIKEVSSTYE